MKVISESNEVTLLFHFNTISEILQSKMFLLQVKTPHKNGGSIKA